LKGTSVSSGEARLTLRLKRLSGRSFTKETVLMKRDLINWSTDFLLGYVQTIASLRMQPMAVNRDPSEMLVTTVHQTEDMLDEVVEVSNFPKVRRRRLAAPMDLDTKISPVVC
jgi:hypothetical protein